MSVKDINNTAEILRTIMQINNSKITVGLHDDAGKENLLKGSCNEFGTDTIPERSFIRGGYDSEKNNIADDAQKIVERIAIGQLKVKAGLNLLGDTTKGRIQEFAIDLRDPPNASSTIKQKGSSNPLVDTGQMIGAIDYKVKG